MVARLANWLRPAVIQQAVNTPGELEQISGLGVDMQRVWRRRGQLPSHGSGHARFTIAEVVEIALRVSLSRTGVSPRRVGVRPFSGCVSRDASRHLMPRHC